MRVAPPRMAFIDALKAIASQLIVLHHLAFYGPMSDVANDLAPSLFSWLSQDARIAVQIFLVIGGFLAARTLAPSGILTASAPLQLLKKRYVKLVIPYIAAILLSICCATIARSFMDHDSIPNPPSSWQMLAHIALLQNILDFDSLSAGAWYVTIDFQLFSLLLLTLWLARRAGGHSATAAHVIGLLLAGGLVAASLFGFNRDSDWDNWGLYFFGAYGLGALTYWATEREDKPDWLLILSGIVIAALIIDYRSRIAVALLTALALGISRRWGFLETRPKGSVLAYLGKISYSVFLAHFPVVLVINALFSEYFPDSETANAVGVLLAWAASIAAGGLFYRLIESRTSYWQARLAEPFVYLFSRSTPPAHDTKS